MMASSEPTSRKKLLRGIGCAFAGLLLFALLVPLVANHEQDETIPDPRRQVPDDQNVVPALVAAMQAAPALPPGLIEYPVPTPSDRPEILALLADSAATFDALDRALARPELVLPKPTAASVTAPAFHRAAESLRAFARLQIQRGYRRLELGDTAGAIRDFERVVETGARAADGGGAIVDYLVGVAVEAIGLSGLRRGLGSVPTGADLHQHDPTVSWPDDGWSNEERALWRGAIERLAHWDEEPQAFQDAMAAEYQVQKERFLDPSSMGVGGVTRYPTLVYMPRQTVALARRATAEMMRQAELPPWERDLSKTVVPPPRGTGYLVNPIGKILLGITSPIAGKSLAKADGRRAAIEVTQAHIAIKLYLEDHGRLPADWSELVGAGLLSATPLDPFTGKPLVYKPREGLVYSVGENGRDDGGSRKYPADDRGEALRFVVPLDPPAAAGAGEGSGT